MEFTSPAIAPVFAAEGASVTTTTGPDAFMARFQELEARVARVESALPEQKSTIICASNDLDRLLPAFIISTGAASMGMKAEIFFTFWGLSGLKQQSIYGGKTFIEKMLTVMMPNSAGKTKLSKMHMMGIGTMMMRNLMEKHNIESLPRLIQISQDLGVRMIACQMTMSLMGITEAELMPGIEYGGVATYLESASKASLTLYI